MSANRWRHTLGAALAATMSIGIATPADARTTASTPGECRAATGGIHNDQTASDSAACPNDASPLATPPVTTAPVPSVPSGAQARPEPVGHPAQTATGVAQKQWCGPPYIDGDARLGPRFLPHIGLLGRILRGYVPLGGLSGSRFIYRYRKDDNSWRYPPDLGFAHDGHYPNGRPLRSRVTLGVGKLIDRFGGPTGDFVSPFGASFVSRALPPDNLNTFSGDPAHPCNYHVYRVIKSFDVDAGPAAPAFQQRGAGLQYFFVAAYVGAPPDKDGGTNINFLVGAHYLEPADAVVNRFDFAANPRAPKPSGQEKRHSPSANNVVAKHADDTAVTGDVNSHANGSNVNSSRSRTRLQARHKQSYRWHHR